MSLFRDVLNSMGIAERIEAYIRNVEEALLSISPYGLSTRERELLRIAKSYVDDARHFLEREDYYNAMATVAYAEGLLDALRIMGLVDFSWPRTSRNVERSRVKVFVSGTFDILHPGHAKYIYEAWKLGRVVAVVAHDETVRRFKKRDPIIPGTQRAELLGALRYVERARVGYPDDMFRVVEEERPNIILLGPDQPFDEETLRRKLRERGLEVEVRRMEGLYRCPMCSTSAIVRSILERFCNKLSL